MADGGVCYRCRKATCLDHLHLVRYKAVPAGRKQPPRAYFCESCILRDKDVEVEEGIEGFWAWLKARPPYSSTCQ